MIKNTFLSPPLFSFQLLHPSSSCPGPSGPSSSFYPLFRWAHWEGPREVECRTQCNHWGLSGCRQGFVGRKQPGSVAFQVPLGFPLKNHLPLRTPQGIIFPRGALYASLYWVTFSPSPVKCFIRAVAGLLVCTLA